MYVCFNANVRSHTAETYGSMSHLKVAIHMYVCFNANVRSHTAETYMYGSMSHLKVAIHIVIQALSHAGHGLGCPWSWTWCPFRSFQLILKAVDTIGNYSTYLLA